MRYYVKEEDGVTIYAMSYTNGLVLDKLYAVIFSEEGSFKSFVHTQVTDGYFNANGFKAVLIHEDMLKIAEKAQRSLNALSRIIGDKAKDKDEAPFYKVTGMGTSAVDLSKELIGGWDMGAGEDKIGHLADAFRKTLLDMVKDDTGFTEDDWAAAKRYKRARMEALKTAEEMAELERFHRERMKDFLRDGRPLPP